MENFGLEKVNLSLNTLTADYKSSSYNSFMWELDYNILMGQMKNQYKTKNFNIVLKSITYQTTTDVGSLKVKIYGDNFISQPKYIGLYRTDDPNQQNFVLNGSFESPQIATNENYSLTTVGGLTNWAFTGNTDVTRVINGQTAFWGTGGMPQQGNQLLVFQNGPTRTLKQELIGLKKGYYTFYCQVKQRTTNVNQHSFSVSLDGGASYIVDEYKPPLDASVGNWYNITFDFLNNDTSNMDLWIVINKTSVAGTDSCFIDNIRIYKKDNQTDNNISLCPITFQYNEYNNKFKLNVDLEEGFSDVLNTTLLPNQTFNFEIYPIKE